MTPAVQRVRAPAPCLARARSIIGIARRLLSRRTGIAALGILAAIGTRDASAQGPLSVKGKVARQTLDGLRIVAREQVTLHRVNSREAGPIDSIVTDAAGAFAFKVATPDSLSMYLASARFGGIAYFSSPVQPGQPAGAPSEIVVYDTTSGDVRLQLQGRHLVVSSPNADGVRAVIDVLEIENDTVLTRVAGAANRPTYSLLLPAGATNVRASQGELSDGAVEVRSGRADIFAPLSPGLRQLVLTYDLPASAFPVSVPLERAVAVLEVLLEEPGATADGGGLKSQGGVSVDGKNFTRYLGQSAPASAVVTLKAAGGIGGTSVPTWVLPLVLTLVTLGVIVVVARRPAAHASAGVGRPAPSGERTTTLPASVARSTDPQQASAAMMPRASVRRRDEDDVLVLARHVASVDELLAREPAPSGIIRVELEEYREARKAELVDALARRTPVR